jgi:hypothetical protein
MIAPVRSGVFRLTKQIGYARSALGITPSIRNGLRLFEKSEEN